MPGMGMCTGLKVKVRMCRRNCGRWCPQFEWRGWREYGGGLAGEGRQDLEHGSKGPAKTWLALLNDSSCFSVDGTGEGGCGKPRQVLSSSPSSQALPNSTTLHKEGTPTVNPESETSVRECDLSS